MKKSEIKKEGNFNKFEKNLMKAEALKEIGSALENQLKDAEDGIQYATESLDERYNDLMNAFPEDDEIDDWSINWRLESARQNLETAKIRLALLKKIEAFLDKELS